MFIVVFVPVAVHRALYLLSHLIQQPSEGASTIIISIFMIKRDMREYYAPGNSPSRARI